MSKLLTILMMAALIGVVASPAMAEVDKVTICHKPGTPAQKTMEVPAQAVPGHLGHGDSLGECEGEPPINPDENGDNGAGPLGGDNFFGDEFGDFAPEQELEQSAESGDVNQSFEVSQTGDNSNQCVGLQGVANTGNSQNQNGVMQFGGGDDGELELDSDSSIEVSPSNSTNCNQSVNQTATSISY